MTTSSRRNYDSEFKWKAVKLYKTSGRSIEQLGEELGIPPSTYGKWIRAECTEGGNAFPGKGYLKAADTAFTKLRKALKVACEERDILKKALGIFSSVRDKSMNS